MNERVHIFPHIEKTGGTFLLRFYNEIYGPEHVFHFASESGTFIPESEGRRLSESPLWKFIHRRYAQTPAYPLLLRARYAAEQILIKHIPPDQLPGEGSLFQGHFPANYFGERFPDAIRTVVFREPLARTISHYLHWKRTSGLVRFRGKIPYTESVSFEDFALSPELRNFQLTALGSRRLERFDLVGVTERLDQFADQVQVLLGVQLARSLTMYNVSPRGDVEAIRRNLDSGFVRDFYALHRQDVALYRAARGIVDAQRTQFGL